VEPLTRGDDHGAAGASHFGGDVRTTHTTT
jgi:hypothetical protein